MPPYGYGGGSTLHIAVFGKGTVGSQPLGTAVDARGDGHPRPEPRPQRQPLSELQMILPSHYALHIYATFSSILAPSPDVVCQQAVAVKVETFPLTAAEERLAGVFVA